MGPRVYSSMELSLLSVLFIVAASLRGVSARGIVGWGENNEPRDLVFYHEGKELAEVHVLVAPLCC